MAGAPEPPAAAARLASKLQALFDSLPPDEQRLMARLLSLALAQADVTGFSAEPAGHDIETPHGERTRRPIDDFRVNLGLFLEQDAAERDADGR